MESTTPDRRKLRGSGPVHGAERAVRQRAVVSEGVKHLLLAMLEAV